jgi:hypothetical protein
MIKNYYAYYFSCLQAAAARAGSKEIPYFYDLIALLFSILLHPLSR